MKRTISLCIGLMAFAALPALAQAPGDKTGKIHGHVTNPSGASQGDGTVSLSTDEGHTSKYTFAVNSSGDYSGVANAGTYMVVFRQVDTPPNKMVDSFDNVKIVAGQDLLQDIDMSRKAFVDKLPKEEQARLAELKKKNEAATKTNEVIKQVNGDLKTAAQDIKDADAAAATAKETLGAAAAKADIDAKVAEIKTAKYTDVESIMTRDSAAMPNASILWAELGQAEVGLKKYDEALVNYKKALDLEAALQAAGKKADPAIQGLANAGIGEVDARTGKIPDASDAYDAAAKVNPTQAAFYLTNEAKIFFQTNQPDAQVAAADKAIAADPNQAVLYYIKGNGLVGKSTLDPKTNKLIPPPGCLEAYQKYLQLSPTGPYAQEVKDIMAEFDKSVDTGFKAPKKK